MKKQKKTRTFLNIENGGEIIVKICLTIFFLVLAIFIFFLYDGYIYFSYKPYVYKYRYQPFQIHFIDVDDGDAILIKFPDNQTMLIDTGEDKHYDDVNSYIKHFCFLEDIDLINYFIMSHSDSDHIGSADKIIKDFNVQTVYRPKLNCQYEEENGLANEKYALEESQTYNRAITSAYKHGCKMIYSERGIKLNIAGCLVEFLSPKEDSYSKSNNYSAVIMITCKSKKFLFTGDAETEIEQELVSTYGEELKADVLKVGHHGSATSTSQEFLSFVKPSYAVISCKGYGTLPNADVLNRLYENKISVLTTSKFGTFGMSLDKNDIVFAVAEIPQNGLALILVGIFLLNCIIWRISINKLKLSSLKNDI